MMVKRGRGKEGWWQSWHGERDTHCTLRWRKRRRAAPLHHIPVSKHRRGEREESQDVKKKKTVKRTSTTDQPLPILLLSSSWVSVWFHIRAPYRSTSRVLRALLGAGVRRPTTGRRRRGTARYFLLDGTEPCWSHLCLRTPSLQKSPPLFLEELGLCPLLQLYRWVFVLLHDVYSLRFCTMGWEHMFGEQMHFVLVSHMHEKKIMFSVQNVCWVTFRIKYVWGKKMQITFINELTRW